MLKEIIDAGGKGYLIPAVLFILVLYAIRGLFGLHGRHSQHRKEFLELWDNSRSKDDLWLEVAVRHLFGTYLPAQVIRLALAQPDNSQALRDVSELWPLLAFDRESQTVRWVNKRHATLSKRKMARAMLFVGYFACASFAYLSAQIASHSNPVAFSSWVYSSNALLFAILALTCLLREDTIKTAVTVGEDWVSRINRSLGKPTSNSKK